jgi:hypothetical protein
MRPGFALLLVALSTCVLAWGAHEVGATAGAAELTRVDPGQVSLDGGSHWSDPRWDAEIAECIGDVTPFLVEDAAAHELVRQRVAALCFVRSVGTPEVLWPDRLRVPVELRRPVACVGQGTSYWLVSADGMILSGRWPTPPELEGRRLPVLLGERGEIPGARPGLLLQSAALLDALAIARDLTQFLVPAQLDTLGPVAIDARGAQDIAVDRPGIQILLEDQRLIAFGRSPLSPEPGELPVARKWASIARGLDALRTQDQRFDWDLLDVRWDVPAWRLRGDSASDTRTGARAGG